MSQEPLHRFLDPPKRFDNVVFNFRHNPVGDLSAFALGYHRAGQALAKSLEGRRFPDYEGYPVFFLYRHSLELYLKYVVYTGASLLGLVSSTRLDVGGLFRRHDLGRLVPPFRKIWQAQRWDFEGTGLDSFADLDALIRSIDQIDPQSYTFRYPVTTDGTAALPHHFVLNPIVFAGMMDPFLDSLDGATTALEEHLQLESEARYEFEHYFQSVDEGV